MICWTVYELVTHPISPPTLVWRCSPASASGSGALAPASLGAAYRCRNSDASHLVAVAVGKTHLLNGAFATATPITAARAGASSTVTRRACFLVTVSLGAAASCCASRRGGWRRRRRCCLEAALSSLRSLLSPAANGICRRGAHVVGVRCRRETNT